MNNRSSFKRIEHYDPNETLELVMNTSQSYLFEINGAKRTLSDTFALKDINLRMQPGEIIGFVGANGAGKTTVIRALLGLLHLDGGKIHLFGQPFGANAPDSVQRELCGRIGVVFDTCPFPSELTVKQAVACISPTYPQWDAGTFDSLLRDFDIKPKKKVKNLSRGMSMKLQLACALSHGADLLVLDEATAGLDPIARDEILERLSDFASDGSRGVLLSSHITSDLEHIADRVVGINEGTIIFDLPREEITDTVGVAHCTAEQAKEVLAVLGNLEMETEGKSAGNSAETSASECFGVSLPRALQRAFSVDILVPDRFAFAQAFPDVTCDRTTIEEYLQFALKGTWQLSNADRPQQP